MVKKAECFAASNNPHPLLSPLLSSMGIWEFSTSFLLSPRLKKPEKERQPWKVPPMDLERRSQKSRNSHLHRNQNWLVWGSMTNLLPP